MRRISAWILCGLLLAGHVSTLRPLFAQATNADQQQKAMEFEQLWESFKKPLSGDDRVSIAERALKIEEELSVWTLERARNQVRGEILWHLAVGLRVSMRGDRSTNIERSIGALQQAGALITREADAKAWAGLQYNLALSYRDRIVGEPRDNLGEAIAAYERALTVYTLEAMPREWAQAQFQLAGTYVQRGRPFDMNPSAVEGIQRAVEIYERLLETVYTRDAYPIDWARTKNELSTTYADRRLPGPYADNLEKSISAREDVLGVFTRDSHPIDWAKTQSNLARGYIERIRGGPAENIEKAIASCEQALEVLRPDTFPNDWAYAQYTLSNAYFLRVYEDRADNIEKSIAAAEMALTVYTREASPKWWIELQNALALAYSVRIHGRRSENLEKRISHVEAMLEVSPREANPYAWASIQDALGGAYHDLSAEKSADDNLIKAIARYEAALTVFTREAWPQQWAESQANMARSYTLLSNGSRAENLERAIASFTAALSVLSFEAFPTHWPNIQQNLAIAYRARQSGDRSENLARAIKASASALATTSSPRDRLRIARSLGGDLLEVRDWSKASSAFETARQAFLQLFGQGLNEAEARDIITAAGPMFGQAAFAAAQNGESEKALSLASEGRARLIAVALKLQTIELPAQNRKRLDELRAEIRVADRTVEVTQGTERAATVEKLVSLRHELLKLIDGVDAAETNAQGSALTDARLLAGDNGAVVVPIVTKFGGKLLLVTNRLPFLTALDVPDLTSERVKVIMRGDGKTGGWLNAYNINYLPYDEQSRRWSEWQSAITGLGPELWRLIGARLTAALKERGITPGGRLVWLPTGALGILPLGLAQDPSGRGYLADNYEIVYASSLDALALAQREIVNVGPPTLTVVVNPTNDLLGTEKEAQLVASHFREADRTVLLRESATSLAVLAALKGKTHWHFASHGTFSWDDARQSALIMHGGEKLSVGRLLDADGLGRPRLVVLSACETGLYDIDHNSDEFIGLPGTFTALGASGVLGTLWPVSDAATALLMAKFYELYMGKGLAPPTALRKAQLWLRQGTNADLTDYARIASEQGRLDRRHLSEIEEELSEEGLKRSRNFALFDWIAPSTARDEKNAPSVRERVTRPYAHPYFWAGFIHTGL